MGRNLAIFGAGLSGQAASRLGESLGYKVTLFDESGRGDCNAFGPGDSACFDRFVFSPGFAAEHPWRVLVQKSGKPIQSEMGFAAGYWKGRILAVTGTNGKSTLTRLMVEGLECAGEKAVAAGNIGQPLSDRVLTAENSDSTCAVCEISSFQSELPQGLELDGLLWTNFAEDHLDRYRTMSDYFQAKANLLACLKPESICVIGREVVEWAAHLGRNLGSGSEVAEQNVWIDRLECNSIFKRPPQSKNFDIATAYWRLRSLPDEALFGAANKFILDPHRLEPVREKEGVIYWNDSKATNFHAALAAVEALPRPIIWIGGGRPKGGDLQSFARNVSTRIDGAVLYGEAAPELIQWVRPQLDPVRMVPAFDQAVREAFAMAAASAPCNLLLSPGFSSFDQFNSYQDRGKTFNSMVLGL